MKMRRKYDYIRDKAGWKCQTWLRYYCSCDAGLILDTATGVWEENNIVCQMNVEFWGHSSHQILSFTTYKHVWIWINKMHLIVITFIN